MAGLRHNSGAAALPQRSDIWARAADCRRRAIPVGIRAQPPFLTAGKQGGNIFGEPVHAHAFCEEPHGKGGPDRWQRANPLAEPASGDGDQFPDNPDRDRLPRSARENGAFPLSYITHWILLDRSRAPSGLVLMRMP